MRKVELNMNQKYRYELIKQLSDTNGNRLAVALKLNCSVRTVTRWIERYRAEGKAAFIHKNTHHPPATTFSPLLKEVVIQYFLTEVSDANLTHFSELVQIKFKVKIHPETLRLWLLERNIFPNSAHRVTRHRVLKALKAKQASVSKKEAKALENQIKQLEYPDVHPRRPRCAYFGELLQMDASMHRWFGDRYAFLHIAVDDATSTIVGAYFDLEETLNGYFHVMNHVLFNYGIPAKILTDRRTIFEYKKASPKYEDTLTQFAYACQRLGTELQTSSVPQAKGRVERMFRTLQSRLIVELRLHGITTLEEANRFLPGFILLFNQQFALRFDSNKSVFEAQPSQEEINLILVRNALRSVDRGQCVRFNNHHYRMLDRNGSPAFFTPRTELRIIQTFDGRLLAANDDQLFALEEVPQHVLHSPVFDPPVVKKPHKPWIPSMDHPYKRASYLAYLEKKMHASDPTPRRADVCSF